MFAPYDNTPALVYGPSCGRLHGFDEFVHLESVRQITKSAPWFISRWCALKAHEIQP